jgi:WD40 repeat protein
MKVIDFNGVIIKDFGGLEHRTFFLNQWVDADNIYIINCNTANVQLYSLSSGNIIHSFEGKIPCDHLSAFVMNLESKDVLIESDILECIRVWDIKQAKLLKVIATKVPVRGLLKWNDNTILAAGNDGQIKVIDIAKESLISSIDTGLNCKLSTLGKLQHPVHGESLLVSGYNSLLLLYNQPSCLII